MASCRSSAWAFLRGEKKCIDYRSIERGLAVVFVFSFSDANGERGGGERKRGGREKRESENGSTGWSLSNHIECESPLLTANS